MFRISYNFDLSGPMAVTTSYNPFLKTEYATKTIDN